MMMKKEEKDVVLNKKINVESFVCEKDEKVFTEKEKNSMIKEIVDKRLIENKNIFTSEELEVINKNELLIKKVYLLAILDSIF